MNARRFDDAARTAAMPRRRSLLFLGGAGAAAALAGPHADAASDAKKRCKKQKKQCRQGVQAFCGQLEGKEVESCLNAVLPCCQTCKVKAGVECALSVI